MDLGSLAQTARSQNPSVPSVVMISSTKAPDIGYAQGPSVPTLRRPTQIANQEVMTMGKWKRVRYAGNDRWYLESGKEDAAARVWDVGELELEIWKDPRTGKPWKSMKAAREWFDLVSKPNKGETE